MTQICLHRLDIVPAFDGSHGVTMTKIMETGVLIAKSASNLFEFLINRYVHKMAPKTIREHQSIRITPSYTGYCLLRFLLFLPPLKKVDNIRCNSNETGSAVFCRDKRIISANLLSLLQLLVDIQSAAIKIHAVPGQSKNLPLPQTCK